MMNCTMWLECQAYRLYAVWEDVVDLQGVVIREARQFPVEDHPGHLALWLGAIKHLVLSIHSITGCTEKTVQDEPQQRHSQNK